MNIKSLKWDSDFFGIRIGRIEVDYNEIGSDVRSFISDNEDKFDLIYIFCDKDFVFEEDEKCKLVDEKVVYSGELREGLTNTSNIKEYVLKNPCDQLYRLSYISGKYSRYKTDTRFADGSFERLYGRWIENSVNKTFADKVLCYHDEKDVIKGMVTIRFVDEKMYYWFDSGG